MSHPTDNLVRARYDMRATRMGEDDDGRTMFGSFAVFNEWTQINSVYEGRFLERLAPSAFDRTFAERADKIRVLYDHGADPFVGNKPLGVIGNLRATSESAEYEVKLFDTDYVSELLPALRANQLGASFRFRVIGEDWVDPRDATEWNPERLSERTITDVDLFEFGPVTFPAYESATAGVRSATDQFIDHMLRDPLFVARFAERAGAGVVQQILDSVPADGDTPVDPVPSRPADSRQKRTTNQRRAAASLAGVRI